MARDRAIYYHEVMKFLKGTEYEELLPISMDTKGCNKIFKEKYNSNPFAMLLDCTSGWSYNLDHDMSEPFSAYDDGIVYVPIHFRELMGHGLISVGDPYYDDYSEWLITEVLDCEEEFRDWRELAYNK